MSHYMDQGWLTINLLAPGKFERNFRYVILKQILMIAGLVKFP